MMEIWSHESTEFLRIERLNEVFLGIQLLAKLTVQTLCKKGLMEFWQLRLTEMSSAAAQAGVI